MAQTRQRGIMRGLAALAGGALLAGLAALPGCARPPAPPPAPPGVTVVRPARVEVTDWDAYPGRLAAPELATVAARVSGLVVAAPFHEGAVVHRGDVLFQIDPRPFQVELQSREADIAKAQAQVAFATIQRERYENLLPTKAVSQQDYDNAVAMLQQAQATLAGARAAADTARLNLEWTRVTAPISGRVSNRYVTEGNIVTGGGGTGTTAAPPTQLTTIASLDPLYCYIDIEEPALLRYQELAARQGQQDLRSAHVPCEIAIANRTTLRRAGVVDFLDNRVDPGTGTLRLRGVIPNADGALTPGLFARMRIPASAAHPVLLVPDAAVGAEQNMRYLVVIGTDDKAERRPVQLGRLYGSLRGIAAGLQGDERVVVQGLQMARPGTQVTPHEEAIPPSALEAVAREAGPAETQPATQAPPETRPTETQPATRPAPRPETGP